MAQLWDGVNVLDAVNDVVTGTQSTPRIVILDATRYLVIWTSDTVPGGVSDPEVRGRIFSTSGAPLGAEFAINSTATGAQTSAVAAKLTGGGFVVAWQDDNSAADGSGSAIRFQRFDDNGAKVGGESVANVTATGNQTRPSIAGLIDGGFVVTWSDASQTGGDTSGLAVRGLRYDSTGTASGSEFLVNTATNRSQTASQVVALQTGGFAVVWQDESPQGVASSGSRLDLGSDIVIRVYDAAGAPLSAQRPVDARTPPNSFINGGSDNGFITARNPAAAVLSDGRIAVTWIDSGFTYARMLNADGTTASGVLTVDSNRSSLQTLEPQNLGSAPVVTSTAITALANGGFVVGWAEARQVAPEELTQGVWARAYDATGTAEGRTFRLNSAAAGDQIAPALAAFANGDFIAAWQDGGTTDIGARLFATTTGSITDIALSGPIDRLGIGNLPIALLDGTGAVNAQYTFTLLNDPSGAFAISGDRLIVVDPEKLWAYAGNTLALQVQATDQQGNTYIETLNAPIADVPYGRTLVAGAEIVAAEQSAAGRGAAPTDLLALPGNRQLLVWQEIRVASDSSDIMARYVEADGTVGTAFVVNTVTAGNQLGGRATMIGNDRVLIAWNTNTTTNDVVAQIFDLAGGRIGGTFVVNTTTTGSQSSPALVGMPSGFFIAWQDNNVASDGSGASIRGQFFDVGGDKIGSELVINTTTLNAQNGAAASVLVSGRIVVTWTDASLTGGDTSSTAIRGQLINTDGTRFGSEFLVNTTTSGAQSQSAVVALAGGGFAVVWRDFSGTGTAIDSDVRGQVYDASGNRVGGEFIANSQRIGAQGGQSEPSIAADANGGFIVSWSDFSGYGIGDGNASSVKARRFTGDGAPLGAEFLVNVTSVNQQNIAIVRALSDGDLSFAFWDLSLVDGFTDAARIVLRTFDAVSANRIAGATSGDDVLVGTVGPDSVAGLDGNDRLEGGGGDDTLDGGTGTDTLVGGTGSDAYLVDNAGDVVIELAGEGTDTVIASVNYALPDNVENLVLVGSGLTATGNGANNLLTAGPGDVALAGAGGNDAFLFGATLTADDRIDGGEGADVVALQGGYAGLVLGAVTVNGVETISVLPGNDTRFGDTGGNSYSYSLTANDGNVAAGAQLKINAATLRAGEDLTFDGSAERDGSFFIYGGRGTDVLTGGDGADVFFMAENRLTAGDRFNGGAGADVLVIRGSYAATLAQNTFANIETITLMSAADVRFFTGGSAYSYNVVASDGTVAAGTTLTVNGGALRSTESMTWNGAAETDGTYRLFGGSAGDTLGGGAGDDLIYGGLGADVLTGGGGNDVFRYQAAAEATRAEGERITDFSAGDLLDLQRIDANALVDGDQAFAFLGAGAFTGQAGQLRAVNASGVWTVEADVDGDGVADLSLLVTVGGGHQLTASDFVL